MISRRCLLAVALPVVVVASAARAEEPRRISLADYRDRMAAGWIGQMAGVGLGAPTEFRYEARVIPAEQMPGWRPKMVNQFNQDDIYVEMTFLRSLEERGWDLTARQAGIDFANSRYPLWHANRAGRNNLRQGIAPPDSGHPQFNQHADDIDYQIEADFSGLISPGMPQTVVDLGEKFGRLMNYGDGLYGGVFVGAMYAEAFFETEPARIVAAGLRAIPAESQYAECIRDVVASHEADPADWQAAWRRIDAKYQQDPAYRRGSCTQGKHNIDAKLNGAYIVIGLLYGNREPLQTMTIACRCGQDSDCNPSSAGGVLCTSIGAKQLPPEFTSALRHDVKFSHTAYDFDHLLAVCEKLARGAVVRAGGTVETDAAGNEVLVIPAAAVRPGPLEQVWQPGPAANSQFSDEEKRQIQITQIEKGHE